MKRVNQHPPESANPTGRKYWRGHEELHDTPEFRGYLEREFPAGAAEMEADDLSRRSFLSLMGASLALAGFGMSGCRRPEASFVPFAKSVEWQIPGELLHFATSMPRRGAAMPLVVATTDGRPIKVEGNPLYTPAGGGSDAYAQASILDLYDPDRTRSFQFKGKDIGADKFNTWLKQLRTELAADRGASLAFLTSDSNSPTRERLQAEFMRQFPSATWSVWDALSDSNEREAAKAIFGSEKIKVVPQFGAADVVFSLDCDFLDEDEGGLAASREFMAKRRIAKGEDTMNRLYVAENRYTITGGMADHRLRCPAGQIGVVAAALAKALGAAGVAGLDIALPDAELKKVEKHNAWITEAAKDLAAANGRALVVVGAYQPGWVHAIGWAINQALGAPGKAMRLTDGGSAASTSLADLTKKLQSGAIKTLFISGSNPVYTAPSDLKFAEALKKVATVVYHGTHPDETAAVAQWHIPAAHFLESWGDGRASDGSYVAQQPMILPLHGGLSELEILGFLTGREKIEGPALIQETFKTINKGGDEATAWNFLLRNGFVAASAAPAPSAAFNGGAAKGYVQAAKPPAAPTDGAFEVVLIPDYSLYDGRYANNGWLQEMPDPITKLTWDNAVLMNTAMAKKLGIQTSADAENFKNTKELQRRDGQGTGVWGDMVEISVGERKIQAAVLISPGHADHSVSIALGYGRTAGGKIAARQGDKSSHGGGFNAYPLRTTAEPYVLSGAKITRITKSESEQYLFATTQQYFYMEGRALARELPIATYKEHAGFDEHHKSFVQKFGMDSHIPPSADLYTNPPLTGMHKWGMAIDLNTCTGCHACVVACQAENNIPIVGKEQVRRGRVMHWIRMDRYYSSIEESDPDPQVLMQPVTCHHCESAPCETVCPVNATIHTDEGLNAMTYNRCIGTRYCANNCPYKVRRFNYFDYNQRPLDQLRWGPFAEKGMEETLKLSKNPNVTVRMRGVMEKCTFCVQRIEEARIKQLRVARDSNNVKIPTDAFKVACQQACPTEAIVFGDMNDPKSKVVAMKAQDRDYRMLEYLNVKPRLSYQARLRNPNPKMPGAETVGMSSLKDSHVH